MVKGNLMENNSWCSYCDEVNGHLYCEQGYRTDKCKGNKYNCVKQRLKDKAIKKLSNREQYKRNMIQ